METKDQNIETATDSEGNEYISEIESTVTETSEDGTVTVAEITTTADADDPTDVDGQMTITEIAPDGTETVTEYVGNEDGIFKVEEESVFEQAAEAILGVEIEDELTQVMDAEGNLVGEAAEEETGNVSVELTAEDTDVFNSESEDPPVSIEFNLGDEEFQDSDTVFDTQTVAETDTGYDPTLETIESDDDVFSGADTSDLSGIENESDSEILEQQAQTEAATEAQQAADDFVEKGDYGAAAEAREAAEDAAWEAGDNSMLSGSDSQELEAAAEKQEEAEYYEQQQAANAQAGDYEAAKEDAQNAAYATGDADYLAGGDDHTGQADSEVSNMDNAIWHEGLAEDRVEDAVYHAEMGNEDAAESALNMADAEQETADAYGDKGEHGGAGADFDPSSVVETGGTYESTDDYLSDIDTGFDANADMTDSGFDPGLDTSIDSSVDTGFDSGIDSAPVDTDFDSGMEDV
ncbi:MAG: hypothetical protein R2681_10090 [Pyrinomonadaceae bacterium]